MSRPRMRLLTITIALALGACSSDFMSEVERTELAYKTAPLDYRADILSFMRTYLNDPTNVRGAFVSEPELRTLDGVSRYAVCLRYNAKNSSGQYAGSKDSMVLFRSGRLDRIVDDAREQCRDARYRPFPELERLTR